MEKTKVTHMAVDSPIPYANDRVERESIPEDSKR